MWNEVDREIWHNSLLAKVYRPWFNSRCTGNDHYRIPPNVRGSSLWWARTPQTGPKACFGHVTRLSSKGVEMGELCGTTSWVIYLEQAPEWFQAIPALLYGARVEHWRLSVSCNQHFWSEWCMRSEVGRIREIEEGWCCYISQRAINGLAWRAGYAWWRIRSKKTTRDPKTTRAAASKAPVRLRGSVGWRVSSELNDDGRWINLVDKGSRSRETRMWGA